MHQITRAEFQVQMVLNGRVYLRDSFGDPFGMYSLSEFKDEFYNIGDDTRMMA